MADALQTGEWGVDVVETQSAESFLMAMGWEEKTGGKSIEVHGVTTPSKAPPVADLPDLS